MAMTILPVSAHLFFVVVNAQALLLYLGVCCCYILLLPPDHVIMAVMTKPKVQLSCLTGGK